MFLMAHPDGDRQLSDVNLISYAMIKLSKCGGLYTKAIERWQIKAKENKKIWANFCQHLITEYENLLVEGGGTTLGQEGYGTVFNATESTMEESSINESIFCYAERATSAEGNVQALEDRLNQLDIGNHHSPLRQHTMHLRARTTRHTRQQLGLYPPPMSRPWTSTKWTGKAKFQQQGHRPRKRVRIGSQRGGRQPVQFSHSTNIT